MRTQSPNNPYGRVLAMLDGYQPDSALGPALHGVGYDGRSIYGGGRGAAPAVAAAHLIAGAYEPVTAGTYLPVPVQGVGYAPVGYAPVGCAQPVGVGAVEPYNPRDDSIVIIGQDPSSYEDQMGDEVVLLVGASKINGQVKKLAAKTGRKAPVMLRGGATPGAGGSMGGTLFMRDTSSPMQTAIPVAADEVGQPLDGLIFADTANPAAGAAFTLTITPQVNCRLDNFFLMAAVSLQTTRITNIAVGTQPLFGNTEATANGVLGNAFSPDNTAFSNLRRRQLAAQVPLTITGVNDNAAQQRVSIKADGTAILGAIQGRYTSALPSQVNRIYG